MAKSEKAFRSGCHAINKSLMQAVLVTIRESGTKCEFLTTWQLLHAYHLIRLTWDDTKLGWPLAGFAILWYLSS